MSQLHDVKVSELSVAECDKIALHILVTPARESAKITGKRRGEEECLKMAVSYS